MQADPWECFRDEAYYDMWCLRRENWRTFGQGYHLMRGEEAQALRDLLNQQDAELARMGERLEIDPAHSIDGIYARDETIRGLDAKVNGLEERMAEAYQLAGSIAFDHDISGPEIERLLDLLSGQSRERD